MQLLFIFTLAVSLSRCINWITIDSIVVVLNSRNIKWSFFHVTCPELFEIDIHDVQDMYIIPNGEDIRVINYN